MLSHVQFKELVESTLPDLTPEESMVLRAVALHETSYGSGWGNPKHTAEPEKARISNNLGSITMAPLSKNDDGTVVCGPNGFRHGDSRRDEKTGKVVQYETCFRMYPDMTAAIIHLEQVLLKNNVRTAAKTRSLHNVARAMRDNNYYLGTAKTREGQIAAYETALKGAVASIVAGTGEPDPLPEPGPAPLVPGSDSVSSPGGSSTARLKYHRESVVVALGSKGPIVKVLQAFLSRYTDQPLLVDGYFGPVTRDACYQVLGTTHADDSAWERLASELELPPTVPETPISKGS